MDWIQAMLNLMEGDVHTWALPALEELRDGKLPYKGVWNNYMEAFTCCFILLDPVEAAREAIKCVRQSGKSMAEYKAKFNKHASLTGWSEQDLRSQFYDGLNDEIKDALAISDRPVSTLRDLVDSA